MVPSSRLAFLAAVPLALALVALWEHTLVYPMLAVDGVIVLAAVIDALAGRRRLVYVERVVPRVLSVGRDNPVTLEVSSRARRVLPVLLRDDLPPEIAATGLPARAVVLPRGRTTVTYQLRPSRRGAYTLGASHVRHPTPLGLWLRQLTFARQDAVRVYPDVRAVRTYELLAKQNREAMLARAARLKGGENEFERLRDHQRDDPYRAIDWKATARRQKVTVREYQKERDQSIVCLLDCGRLMTADSGGLTYLDHALNATLMMSHVAARSGDHVGLLAFDKDVRAFLPPSSGARATQKLIVAAYDIHPNLVETDYAVAFDLLERRLPKRALVVLFTQVVDDVAARALARQLRALPRRHLPLCVLFRDEAIEGLLDPAFDQGDRSLYLKGAAAEVVLWRERLEHELKAGGAHVLAPAPSELTPVLVNRYLEIKAKQLL